MNAGGEFREKPDLDTQKSLYSGKGIQLRSMSEAEYPDLKIHSCRWCEDVVFDLCEPGYDNGEGVRFTLAQNYTTAALAAREGCLLFEPLWRHIGPSAEYLLSREHTMDLILHSKYVWTSPFSGKASVGKNIAYCNLDIAFGKMVNFPRPLNGFRLFAFEDDHAAKHISRRLPTLDLSSTRNVCEMQEWLRACDEQHICHRHPDEAEPPTRLIRLANAHAQLSARVYKTSPGEVFRYATLSYAWGPNPQNLHHYLAINHSKIESGSDIPTDDLPLTLKDAFDLTRRLGLEYLWIDCLCIKQDDPAAKAAEMDRMAQIFESAYVNIIAGSARSSDEGLGYKINISKTQLEPIKITLRCPDGRSGRAFLVAEEDEIDRTDTASEAIHKRAWCLQEYLLSSRSLVFYKSGLQKRCREVPLDLGSLEWAPLYDQDWSEIAQPDNIRLMLQETGFWKTVASLSDQKASLEEKEVLLIDLWARVVQIYTCRTLTNQADRLPALAGIASKLTSVTNDVYVAGLWQKHLVRHLLWNKGSLGLDEAYPDVRRLPGPTWSWCSLNIPVSPKSFLGSGEWNAKELVKIIDISVELQYTQASFGAVRNGQLRLLGRPYEALLLTSTQSENMLFSNRNFTMICFGFRDDCWEQDVKQLGIQPEPTRVEILIDADNNRVHEKSQTYAGPARKWKSLLCFKVFCLNILRKPEHIFGLVLWQASPGKFKRLATFSIQRFPKQVWDWNDENAYFGSIGECPELRDVILI